MSDPSFLWIADPAALTAQLADRPTRIGLDTEFIRERTYWPHLALVQISLPTADGLRILLVDPLVPGMTAALTPILADTAVLKVMHSPSEDLVTLRRDCGVVPQPLFDTQQAAALAGIGSGLGYQKLVEQLTGTALAKGETRSDWLRRPLSASQLEYAADDVRHLFEMHDVLDAMLEQLGRRQWLADDATRTLSNADSDAPERWPHASMRSAQFLDLPAQRRLLRVLRWREVYARESDRPKSWILDNELAVAIARLQRPERQAVQQLVDAHPKGPRKLIDTLLRVLETELPDEHEAPDASLGEARDKTLLRKLQEAVAKRSTELGLPDGVLASRRWLEALMDQGDWPDALSGWRRQVLEPVLQPLLAKPAP